MCASCARIVRSRPRSRASARRTSITSRHNRRLSRLQGAFFPTMSLFLGISALLALWLGSRDVMSGRITVGELVAFNAYLAQLAWPMIAFGWVTNLLERGMASWKRMLTVMETIPAVRDEQGLETGIRDWGFGIGAVTGITRATGAIEFRNLSFLYGDREVLSDVSFSVKAGETVAIVGGTGSGKSTLVNLLPRLQNPPRGTVFIDGRDVRDIPLGELRGAIGFVPQEPFLFSDTLADNVAFGVPRRRSRSSRARIEAAAGSCPAGQRRARLSARATTPWSGSAASRCRAARNSAPRSRAPS